MASSRVWLVCRFCDLLTTARDVVDGALRGPPAALRVSLSPLLAQGMVSQFYVLSPRGDSIIFRDFRGDIPKTTTEVFFRNVKFWNGKQQEAPPVFNIDGINYLYIKKNGLYFVITNKYNVSPSFGIELLTRLTKLFKDYCGVRRAPVALGCRDSSIACGHAGAERGVCANQLCAAVRAAG